MWFKAKCSRRKSSLVVTRQCQSPMLPGSYSDSAVDLLKEVGDPGALISLLENLILLYSSQHTCKL